LKYPPNKASGWGENLQSARRTFTVWIMGLKIRKAVDEDIPALQEAKTYTIENVYGFLSEAEKERWVEHSTSQEYFQTLMERPDTLVVVADSDGKIVGMCAIARIEDGAERWADVTNIFSIGELKGIGKAMLGAAIAIAEGWKLREMRVPVFLEDSHTLNFFQRWDFYPSHHTEHQQLPGRSLLYLKRPLRARTRPRDDDEGLYRDPEA
jgi:GNAT superfamily N-acetyltransferase